MMTSTCSRSAEVARAVSAGAFSTELRDHASRCQTCLAAWLTSAVHGTAAPPPRLDASALWERASRMRRLRAEAQMSRIITGAQVAAGVIILAVLVFFGSQSATWSWLTLPGQSSVLLAAGVSLVLLTALGVSRLIAQE
jgi:hypothetical protein